MGKPGRQGLLSQPVSYALPMDIRVELAPGTDDPAVVWFGRRRVPVVEVADRWWSPDMRWWKVVTDEGAYILRRPVPEGAWELAAVPRG